MAARDGAGLRARLDAGLAAMGPGAVDALDGAARDRLIRYIALLAQWNRTYNLTAVRDPEAMVPRHLLDSLAVLPWVRAGPVLDVGTGAGLPGIPLAVARPDLAFTLLDSNGKKTRFVRHAAAALRLDNVSVVHSRLEAYRPGPKFATITARAVASLATLCDGADHLASAGARLLALKGRLPEEEIAALRGRAASSGAASAATAARLGIHHLAIPGLDGERTLIEVPLGGSIHG